MLASASFAFLLLFAGCLSDGPALTVTLTNQTSASLHFVEIGGVVGPCHDVELPTSQDLVLTSDRLGYTTFRITYGDGVYEGDSGLTDDYGKYQLIFRDADAILTCKLNLPGSGDRSFPLTKVE